MEFTNGESLGDASATGFVMKEGEKLLQYTYDGSTTNLIEKGKEAGSYKPASGSGDELVLDGFGGGKIGTKEGTYTISDGTLTRVRPTLSLNLLLCYKSTLFMRNCQIKS